MPKVWYVLPSVRPVAEAQDCLDAWSSRGYATAVIRQGEPLNDCAYQAIVQNYLGYTASINILALTVLQSDRDAEWIVAGGDDQYPDIQTKANHISDWLCDHFQSVHEGKRAIIGNKWPYIPGIRPGSTFGVMQPTGDRHGDGYIDTAAASAWIGRQFCECAYAGMGPLWPGYFHFYGDRELQAVATNMGIFHQVGWLKQEHKHWTRTSQPCPDFLQLPNSMVNRDRDLYELRESLGFPGYEVKHRVTGSHKGFAGIS